jgi:lactate 2-monooxygenase
MANYGMEVQMELYQPDATNAAPRLPVSFEDWESEARNKLADGPYFYVAGGAGAGDTMRANLQAFERWRIQPRMLCDVSNRQTQVDLLGTTLPAPILLAPIGVQSIVHPDAELAPAHAAAQLGLPFIASTASSRTLEQIASVMGDAPRWFQLYWGKDEDVTASLLQRAEQAGYSALVVTLDTPMLSWREQDLANAYLPFIQAEGIANYLTDPAFCSKLKRPPREDIQAAVRYFLHIFSNPSLTWSNLAFLREKTKLPIVLKGILHPRDAEFALAYGVDGIIVSNHGGRQVDGAIAALDALPEVCDVVQGRVPVLMDSGIRRGADVVKAIALGADAVLVGRPYMYGLAVGGEAGVRRVMKNLLADFDLTMALSGRASLAELDKSALVRV